MPAPYSFPVTSTDFQGCISNPASSLCGNIINTLLKLPLLAYQFISTMIDTNGNLTQTFLSMIYRPGDIKTSAAAQFSDPQWLFCNGSEYAKATYPDLYAAIGDIYGTAPWPAPSNPNNFRVPNYQCQNLIGVGTVTGSTASPAVGPFFESHSFSIGSQSGADAHILIPGEDVPHQHLVVNNDTTDFGTPTNQNYLSANREAGDNYSLQCDTTLPVGALTSVAGGEISTDPDAITFPNYTDNYKANPHNNMPPSVSVYFYVFAGVPVA